MDSSAAGAAGGGQQGIGTDMNSTITRGLTAITATGLLFAGPVQAHPRLLSAAPPADARVSAPTQVRLGFSETLIAGFSRVTLADAAGHAVKLGPVALSRDHRQLAAPIAARLAPGAYRVHWHAVSTDTHRVDGVYVFSVVR